jgi:riboflavin kinase/FMN adenylyltransferase
MRIFQGFEDLTSIKNPVLTIGTFDGVHIGHQKILQQLNQEAEKIGGESVLFTFYPHPRMVISPKTHGLKLIQTQEEKLEKLKNNGLKNVIIQPFTTDFSNLTATEFVRDYLVGKLKVKKLVIGHDHQFGKNREGTLLFLKNISKIYNFEVIEILAQEIDEVNISSTKIRNAIEQGNIEIANRYLGESFELNGKVVKGKQLGRTIGFPTANIFIDSDIKIIPKTGVYAVEIELPNSASLIGMLNIGVRPTLGDQLSPSIEVNIFDFKGDIYDSKIKVRFLSHIREEIKFNSLYDLKTQLHKDEKISREFASFAHK